MPKKRLDFETVLSIKSLLWEQKVSMDEIARKFSCSYYTIGGIKSCRSHAEVPWPDGKCYFSMPEKLMKKAPTLYSGTTGASPQGKPLLPKGHSFFRGRSKKELLTIHRLEVPLFLEEYLERLEALASFSPYSQSNGQILENEIRTYYLRARTNGLFPSLKGVSSQESPYPLDVQPPKSSWIWQKSCLRIGFSLSQDLQKELGKEADFYDVISRDKLSSISEPFEGGEASSEASSEEKEKDA